MVHWSRVNDITASTPGGRAMGKGQAVRATETRQNVRDGVNDQNRYLIVGKVQFIPSVTRVPGREAVVQSIKSCPYSKETEIRDTATNKTSIQLLP